MDGWDVFVSYSRADSERVRPLVAALRDRGLRTFVDESGVHDFHSISETLVRELGRSKVMLVFYSQAYPERPACQSELRMAFLAAQREGDPLRRILVVNPEEDWDHIDPVELRTAKHWSWPVGPEMIRGFAGSVAERVAAVTGTMSSIVAGEQPRWIPASAGRRSPGFTGRIPELWEVHSALNPAPLMSHPATRMAQIRGIGGIGKTHLAEEYALLYGQAYPGGIFWLSLGDDVLRSYRERLAVIARALAVSGSGPIEDILNRLAGALTEPYLWIVDDVPPGLPPALAAQLRAPHAGSATLWTTRSRAYDIESIELGPLCLEDGLAILTSRRPCGIGIGIGIG